MSAHTPGPWHTTGACTTVREIATARKIADVRRAHGAGAGRERDANARLIAAAPELYEALRTCRAELRNYVRTELGDPNPGALGAIEEADAALATAEGRPVDLPAGPPQEKPTKPRNTFNPNDNGSW